MANAVWKSLNQYNLIGRVREDFHCITTCLQPDTQITAFVMDNATNNDTLVDHFASKCAAEGISFSVQNGRMRCLPHIIHLAALEVRIALSSCMPFLIPL
jgi:hypothetical protein